MCTLLRSAVGMIISFITQLQATGLRFKEAGLKLDVTM